jgi:cytochrome c-type biogenesis protein CcmH/NrfG
MNSPSNDTSASRWSSQNAYMFVGACLILGIVLGFLMRGAQTAAATQLRTAMSQPRATAVSVPVQVTSDQLKRMADAQAQPLLAQLQANPNDSELLAKIGYVYYATRNFNAAAEYYKRSAAIKDDPTVCTELGRAYYYAGDVDRALVEFNNVLKLDPNNANALVNIGMIRWKDKLDAAGAINVWRLMLRRNPSHPQRAYVEQLIAKAEQHSAAR